MKKFNTIQEIQIERVNNRSNNVIYTMLGVLLGEIDRLPTRETPTADQIYSVINKMYNNAKEMSSYNDSSKIEMEYLSKYIKQQLNEEQLTDIINSLKSNGCKNIGEFMKALNSEYKGQFDGKIASKLISECLKNC